MSIVNKNYETAAEFWSWAYEHKLWLPHSDMYTWLCSTTTQDWPDIVLYNAARGLELYRKHSGGSAENQRLFCAARETFDLGYEYYRGRPEEVWDYFAAFAKLGPDWGKDKASPAKEEQTPAAPVAGATAAKYDKPQVMEGVIRKFPRAIEAIAAVSVDGAKKHEADVGGHSYLHVPDAVAVYENARARHDLAIGRGEYVNEEDGGHLHLAHVAWNALAALEAELAGAIDID